MYNTITVQNIVLHFKLTHTNFNGLNQSSLLIKWLIDYSFKPKCLILTANYLQKKNFLFPKVYVGIWYILRP